MINPGDILHNPVTKEQMTFLKTSAESGGAYCLIELRCEPHGAVAAAHAHPSQTETFEVLSGTMGARVAGDSVEASPGDVVVISPGMAHKWWNGGEDELVFRCEIRPALGFEQLIETMFALARDGKTNRKGMPNPLRLAVIANAHIDDVVLPFPPAWMQKLGLALGAPLGRLLGYEPSYAGVAAVA